MATGKGLGHFLEEKAEGPAYAIVFVCMASRAASFYSGGALALGHLLGAAGLGIYNSVTGLGVAIGSGLVVSIAGRQWRRARADLAEVDSLTGLKRQERAARKEHLRQEIQKQGWCMLAALVLETSAALFFFWTGNTQHDLATFLGESCISGAAVFIAFYFGVMKDQKAADQRAANQVIAYEHRSKAQHEAWGRIGDGTGTPADVYFVAQDLPKQERAATIAALLPRDGDDPIWQVPQIMEWLGSTDPSVRRKLYRKLGKVSEQVPSVVNDPTSGWQLPRSVAWKHFMPLFIELRSGQTSDIPVTRVRHMPRGKGLEKGDGQDSDATLTGRGQVESGLVAVND